MARKYTTGFEQADAPGSNYYDPSRPTRDFVTGRNGQAIKGTWAGGGVSGPTVLPPPPGGQGGGPPGAWVWEVPVTYDVAIIMRAYIKVPDLPSSLKTLLLTGIISWVSGLTTYGLSNGISVKVDTDGAIGLGFTTATDDEVAASLADPQMPGTSSDFPWGSGGPVVAGTWHCLEIAERFGAAPTLLKGYAALRLDGEVISEAPCIRKQWIDWGGATGSRWGFFQFDLDFDWYLDDLAINDETGDEHNSWPGPDDGVFYGDEGGCFADPAGSGYYDCGLTDQPAVPASCMSPPKLGLPISGTRILDWLNPT